MLDFDGRSKENFIKLCFRDYTTIVAGLESNQPTSL